MTNSWRGGWQRKAEDAQALNEQYREKIRSLNMALDSIGRAVHQATGTPIEDGQNYELAMARLAEMGAPSRCGAQHPQDGEIFPCDLGAGHEEHSGLDNRAGDGSRFQWSGR